MSRTDTPNKLAVLAAVSNYPGSTVREYSLLLGMAQNYVRVILYELQAAEKISCRSVHGRLHLYYPGDQDTKNPCRGQG